MRGAPIATPPGGPLAEDYQTGEFYDEVFQAHPNGGLTARPHYRANGLPYCGAPALLLSVINRGLPH